MRLFLICNLFHKLAMNVQTPNHACKSSNSAQLAKCPFNQEFFSSTVILGYALQEDFNLPGSRAKLVYVFRARVGSAGNDRGQELQSKIIENCRKIKSILNSTPFASLEPASTGGCSSIDYRPGSATDQYSICI
jgi:hypothetical protein